MTILKKSDANERPLSSLVLTHTPLLVPAIPSLLVPFLPCFNPFISWFSSLQHCILQSGSITILSCFLHSTFDHVPFSQLTLTLLSITSHLLITWFISLLPFYPSLLVPIHGSPLLPKVFSPTSYLSVHLISDLLPPTFSSP